MNAPLFMTEHGITAPGIVITARRFLCGVFLSVAWKYDGERIVIAHVRNPDSIISVQSERRRTIARGVTRA